MPQVRLDYRTPYGVKDRRVLKDFYQQNKSGGVSLHFKEKTPIQAKSLPVLLIKKQRTHRAIPWKHCLPEWEVELQPGVFYENLTLSDMCMYTQVENVDTCIVQIHRPRETTQYLKK